MNEKLYYDPYHVEIAADPHPVFRRLREEAPLYYNEEYDFYALSRFHDVRRALLDNQTYISSQGVILEEIKRDFTPPPGVFIMEDPPLHTVHRGLLKRVFTPNKMNALEGQIRDYCAQCLDPLVGADRFDFIADLGAKMPMRVIGMLLGIPEADQEAVRLRADAGLRTEAGKPMEHRDMAEQAQFFAEYIEWRGQHPSDDLMTQLLNAEFEDETGTTRKLTQQEILVFVSVLATAGNETTNRLIGWTAKILAEHADQRRQLAADRSLIPNAIEEVLRFEPPADHIGRCLSRDVEHYGQKVPEGSAMLLLAGAANRDESVYPDADRFDIHRKMHYPHLSFGFGAHACLGAALARLEGRVALDEVLNRFTDWEVDYDAAEQASTSTVRGWATLPVWVR